MEEKKKSDYIGFQAKGRNGAHYSFVNAMLQVKISQESLKDTECISLPHR